jgi:DNA polymerase
LLDLSVPVAQASPAGALQDSPGAAQHTGAVTPTDNRHLEVTSPGKAGWLFVVLDWETFYSTALKYSLRVLDTPSYILDPKFEEIGCAVKINGSQTGWIDGPQVGAYLEQLKTAQRAGWKICLIAHNILFDACIASWRHGFVADLYVCTLSLSRALLGHILARNDLASVARYLGLGAKGTTVHKVNGLTRQGIINAGFYNEYAAYSCQDAELCWGVFQHLYPKMPKREIAIADMVHRMAIEPSLTLDPGTLKEHLGQVRADKDMLLAQAGLDMSTQEMKDQSIGILMSNDKFAEILTSMGIDPPLKVSPSDPDKQTYAFAKTDDAMKELAEHPDPAVQAIVAARLGHKSTLEETRTERFLNISQLDFPHYGKGMFPVALKVSGAHTHRLSGDWRLNQQNLARPSRKRPRAMLRESIVAR